MLSAASGCQSSNKGTSVASNKAEAQNNGAPVTIVLGTHYVAGLDPNYVDPVTKKPVMSEADITSAKKALAEVKKQLNVNLKFIQYNGDVTTTLLQSVMAGAPVCDVAWMWGGSQSTILSQNILQPIDAYANIFSGDGSWMLMSKAFGHNYFIDSGIHTMQAWPLVYNITDIEKVDALKQNGKTQYPADLFKEGKWTWNTFEDYLSKINAYYANSKSPDNPNKAIQAYETDYRFAAHSAGFAAGRGAYDEQGLGVSSPEFEQGMSYITTLFNKKLLTSTNYPDSITPQWTQNGTDFGNGETVFTDIPGWLLSGASSSCAKRGESVGIVPWPRPDSLPFDSPKYRQISSASDCMGILKGVDAKKTKLALETMKLYWNVFYNRVGVTPDQYAVKQQSSLSSLAAKNGLDVFNKKAGPGIIYSINYLAKQTAKVNDFGPIMGIENDSCNWDPILGDALYGKEGISSYNVAVQSKMNLFNNQLSQMQETLKSDKIRDNIPPTVKATKSLAFAKGTNPSSIKWTDYISIVDNVDGKIDFSKAKLDTSGTKFDKVGPYDKGLHVTVADKSGNNAKADLGIVVYDPSNKAKPTLKLKAKLPPITLNQDASTINWTDFIDSAKDKDGLDISANVKADISKLDTSAAGKYNVVLTAADFAGNKVSTTVQVTVASSGT